MAVRFANSATRHGISHERARFVVDHCPSPLFATSPALGDSVLFLGPDANGALLEVLAIELHDGDLLVIHAMRLRPRYEADLDEVMRWHER